MVVAQSSGESRNFRRGFQFIKIFALFNVETKKRSQQFRSYTFVAFLSLNIGLSELINLLNPFT